jgi:hypothetical protein
VIDEVPVPDEEVVALDAHVSKLKKLAECSDNIKFWQKEYAKAQDALSEVMGDATIGTVDGVKVLTYRYEDRFRGSDFKKKFPDTWRTFVRPVTEEKFDLALFRASRPEQYEEFRVRTMRNEYTV